MLGAAVVAHTLAWWMGVRPVALDPDPMNLAYGMARFDITHFNPHAPGYLVYVWALRAAHAITGSGDGLADRFATVQLVALLFALAAIMTVYVTARRMGIAAGGAGWAALVLALHPILVFHSIDAQTHTAEAFASALLLLGAILYRDKPGWQHALALGLLLAFGSALRPSFVVVGIPIVVWTIGFGRFFDLAVAGASSVAGAIAWIAPTVIASGGWETWRAATRGLVHHGFVLTSSPFSDTAVGALVWANQVSLWVWGLEVALPLVVAVAVGGVAFMRSEDGRWLEGTLLIGGGFALAYYSATFISEPGYLAALLPPVALAVGASVGGSKGTRPAALAVAATLACWVLPLLPQVLKVPSFAEWQKRTELAETYAGHVASALPDDGRFLVLIGHPDITVGRQLPMLDAQTDALLVHDGRRPWIGHTSLTYVTEVDSVPIPEAFGPPGAGASLRASERYAGIYFDGSLPPHFQAQVAEQSTCPTKLAADVTETVLLPARCFKDDAIALDGLELRLRGN